MTTVNEQIVTGRKFRKLIDEATKLWQKISFWTKASDVEFDDGKTAETKVGAIDGITDSMVSTSSNIAASAKALSEVNNKLAQGRVEIVVNDDSTLGYRLDGADAVNPFKRNEVLYKSIIASKNQSISYVATQKCVAYGTAISSKVNGSTIIANVSCDGSELWSEYAYNDNILKVFYCGYELDIGQTITMTAASNNNTCGCSLIVVR